MTLDDSYTPSKISLRAGSHFADLVEVKLIEMDQPRGWQHVKLGLHADAAEGDEIDPLDPDASVMSSAQSDAADLQSARTSSNLASSRIISTAKTRTSDTSASTRPESASGETGDAHSADEIRCSSTMRTICCLGRPRLFRCIRRSGEPRRCTVRRSGSTATERRALAGGCRRLSRRGGSVSGWS